MELRKIDASETLLTLQLSGDLDANGSKEALPHIDQVLSEDNHPEIEIDLKHVLFLDSSGVGAIVYMYKRLVERERNMRIENVHGQPLEIITLLRINQAISVNQKREAA
ncbi:STAS domain-containing protein [Vibrio sp. DW001]|jgi:anti-anti-sigma factor|uniref:STAS domain-containing protein n=1 Tax=unclassified Vibrio TaxID=2614977 RepID=UPI0018A09A51|nr:MULTISPECIES: STAS domain-containing protein [unclassified Vibrio]UGA57714.1 STAS domain-containing protein [Vibrio sp. VB16]WED28507.1 STAS domain-containing protein [Vibrio sp. DW001]